MKNWKNTYIEKIYDEMESNIRMEVEQELDGCTFEKRANTTFTRTSLCSIVDRKFTVLADLFDEYKDGSWNVIKI